MQTFIETAQSKDDGAEPALITARNLKITRDGDPITLSLSAGDRVGVLGAEGSGKRQLLQTLALLRRPIAGNIFWSGTPVSRRPRWLLGRLRRHVVLIWGNPYALLGDSVRVSSMIDTDPQYGSIATSASDRILGPIRSASMDTLSALQRVRTALAFARKQAANVVLLADPFASLSPPTWTQLSREALTSVDATQAVVIASQYLEPLQSVDRIYVMLRGTIIEQGPRDRIVTQPQHAYTRWLVNRTSLRTMRMIDWEHDHVHYDNDNQLSSDQLP
jgi:peptide/nickel transport system ATP-binding protein